MTQEIFPEIQAATEALKARIAALEAKLAGGSSVGGG